MSFFKFLYNDFLAKYTLDGVIVLAVIAAAILAFSLIVIFKETRKKNEHRDAD